MKKVIRNGMVAVLYSPGCGAGWYSWGREHPELIFDPDIVEWVENGKKEDIEEIVKNKIGDGYFYTGGAMDLRIEWLPEGTQFEITEYNGSESIKIIGMNSYLTA